MSTPKQITPPDPQRGICPTCGMWARLPVADLLDAGRRMADQYVVVGQVLADTMHAAQVRALGRAGR